MARHFLCILVIGIHICNAQINQSNTLPHVLPVSPTAFEFLKHGEIPVSKYTGLPGITIPIYTIKARGLDVPIKLDYHSNGFRVNEEAGWTGLGWTFNPGGNIVQIIKGFDDFGPRSNRKFIDGDAIADLATSNTAPNGAFSNCSSSTISISSKTFGISHPLPSDSSGEPHNSLLPLSLIIGDKDYEPDVFNFNFLGYSGKFVLDWSTDTFVCLTDSRIKIEKTQNDFKQITIRLPEGHYGLFSVKETSMKEYWNSIGVITNSGSPYLDGEVLSRVYKLDHIYTNQNDHIEFTYNITKAVVNALELSSQYTSYEDRGPKPLATGTYVIPGYGSGGSGLWNEEISTFSTSKQPLSYLDKIKFNKGVIVFKTSERDDFEGASKLDRIEIKESESATENIKAFEFDYSYFIGHTNGTTHENQKYFPRTEDKKSLIEKTHRLKLDALTEIGKPSYSFEYNQTQLPKKNSWATDYWGYYNGKLDNKSLHANLYRFDYELKAPTISFLNSSTNNKSANEDFNKAAILEKISYPSGGYTVFEHELNSFTNYKVPHYSFNNSSSFTENHLSLGGGLRIKMIKNFNHDHTLISQKRYEYEGGKIMSPLQFYNKTFIPSYFYVSAYSRRTGPIWAYAYGYRRKQSSSSLVTPSTNASGSFVGYNSVTEHYVSNSNDTTTLGTVETDFENHVDTGIYDVSNDHFWRAQGRFIELGIPTMEANRPRNGSVIEERVTNAVGELVKKTVNTYSHKIRNYCTVGVKFGPLYSSGYGSHGVADKKYTLGFYPIRGLDSYLTHVELVNFDGPKAVTTKESYTYNAYLQLKEKRVINSDRSVLYTRFKHAIDSKGPKPPLGQASNLTELIIQKNGKTIKHEQYHYLSTTYGNYPTNLISGIENRLTGNLDTFAYYQDGNLKETRGRFKGLKTIYIWDYYGKYPLLKMEGSDQQHWPAKYFIDAVVNASKDYKNHQGLLNAFNNLRRYCNVLVTSYTYNNLIGVASITNQQGETVFYSYDHLRRLKDVSDGQGNILSEHQYNYKH